MQARGGSIGAPEQDALDRRFAGKEAGAVRGRGAQRRVAHRQLERLQLLDDLVERRPARPRPLHFDPAGELVVAGEMRLQVGDVAADIGVEPFLRFGMEARLDAFERRDRVGDEIALRNERRVELRSEEHTSELQSLMRISYAVFCLKKKKTPYNNLYKSSRK